MIITQAEIIFDDILLTQQFSTDIDTASLYAKDPQFNVL